MEGTTTVIAIRFTTALEQSSRLSAIACAWIFLAAAGFAQDIAESLAQRVFTLADSQQFSEADLLLATLAEDHRDSTARVAAVLYASERSFAVGNRPQAQGWLKPLASGPAPQFQAAIDDALAWCQINPVDLTVPTARVLELAERHAASSFAPVALQLRAENLAAAERTDEAIFVYHVLLAQFPKSRHAPTNLLCVARLHNELKQHREAWSYLQRLAADFPQSAGLDEALYLGVQVAGKLGDDQAAADWLQKLVTVREQSPYWADAALRLAEQQAAAGKNDPSRAIAKRLVNHAGGSAEIAHRAQFLLLRLAVADDQWADVEAGAQEILRSKPGEPFKTLADFWYAESAYRRGERDEAYRRFLDLSLTIEGRKEDWLGIVPLRVAQIEAQQQKWATAAEWAEAAARQYPKYSRIYEVDYVLGRSLTGLARFEEARDALTRVITADTAPPDTAAMAQWMIGETWFQQRQYERAIAAYERTINHDAPRWHAAGLLQAAKCCEQLGRWSDAALRYQQLIRDHAASPYMADARSRLEKTQAKVAAQTMTETTTR